MAPSFRMLTCRQMKSISKIQNNLRHSKNIFYEGYEGRFSYYDACQSVDKFVEKISSFKKYLKKERLQIAVIADKSFEHYCLILSVLISDCIWVPVDKSNPKKRIDQIFDQSIPDLIWSDEIDKNYQSYEVLDDNLFGSKFHLRTQNLFYPKNVVQLDTDTCMIFFTSGSTGVPKGVQVSKKGIDIFLSNILKFIGFDRGGTFGDYHSTAFVISVPIILIATFTEGSLHPAKSQFEQMLPNLSIQERGINNLITVPSTMSRIIEGVKKGKIFKKLDILILCGEPFPVSMLKEIVELEVATRVFNCYGSTEGCVWNFAYQCNFATVNEASLQRYVPLGKPLPGNRITIGTNEELEITSEQISPGYVNEDLNGVFIREKNGTRYKTGDVVEQSDGVYFCKGRTDSNIKLNGYRVSLLDIEANINRLPSVTSSVCYLADNQIVGVIFSDTQLNEEIVRTQLLDILPSYMIPKRLHFSDTVLTNKSGKIDRARIKNRYSKQ